MLPCTDAATVTGHSLDPGALRPTPRVGGVLRTANSPTMGGATSACGIDRASDGEFDKAAARITTALDLTVMSAVQSTSIS